MEFKLCLFELEHKTNFVTAKALFLVGFIFKSKMSIAYIKIATTLRKLRKAFIRNCEIHQKINRRKNAHWTILKLKTFFAQSKSNKNFFNLEDY